MPTPTIANFAANLTTERAFDVLAIARKLKAAGKDVVELQIGDSPFPTTAHALAAGKAAIDSGRTHYCPSMGMPEFRNAAAKFVKDEFGIPATAENIVVGPGAKVFETYFCELFLEPGDEVLLFDPVFPTYVPNVLRRGGVPVFANLKEQNAFRPNPADVERFLKTAKRPKAIILNSPHNPTGGVATADDLKAIADLIRGTNVALLSDEPYCHMVWTGKHASILAQPGMMEHCLGAFTFSKSYSMSGWRLGFAVGSPEVVQLVGKMVNSSLSCVPPMVQFAGQAALERDAAERDAVMAKFKLKVEVLIRELKQIPGVSVSMPVGTFYVFPNVSPICTKLGITSHGLAMYLLEGADDAFGVACLGGECFGDAGRGFLRFSCAEPDDRLVHAVHFFRDAIEHTERVKSYLAANLQYRL